MLKDYWRLYPPIKVGPIRPHGDCYYNGVLDAHTEEHFITYYDEYCPDPSNPNVYEVIFYVYKMDSYMKGLYDDHKYASDAAMEIRDYVDNLTPIGYIMENDLDRSKTDG